MLLYSAFQRQSVTVQNTILVAILCSVWWLYLCFGAAVIQAIEAPVAKAEHKKYINFIRSFATKKDCVSEVLPRGKTACLVRKSEHKKYLNFCTSVSTKKESVSEHDLEEFIQGIEAASRMGVSASVNVTGDSTWNLANAIFFAGTLITTIGYGNTAPLSDWGKVFCIIYAAIGVPFTLIMFTALVERLMIPTSLVLQYLVDKLVPRGVEPFHIRLAHLGIVLGLVIVFLVFVPAIVFVSYEPNWTFLDAFYFCVVSLMTIGLGDIVPGEDPAVNYHYLYKLSITLYIAVGLLFVMLLLAVVYEIPEFNLGLHLSMRSDEFEEKGENVRLTNVGVNLPPRYMTQVDEVPETAAQLPNGAVGQSPSEFVATKTQPANDRNSTNEHWPKP